MIESSDNTKIIPTMHPEFAKRLQYRLQSPHRQVWEQLDSVFDPELPGLTIWDLGVLQDVVALNEEKTHWQIVITPTYSGCPAIDAMRADIQTALQNPGANNQEQFEKVDVKVTLSPAWSTDMMSPEGKRHLHNIQIAPPQENDKPSCPLCGSQQTTLISQFGSTACKALYKCDDCFEPFDYFKSF